MKQTTITCIDRDFYNLLHPDSSFEEARAILIGMYQEQDLDSEMATKLKMHLDRCACCTQFLGDLEKIGEFKTAQAMVPFAECPSSEAIDTYLFNRQLIPADRAGRIRMHLEECPLCKEEGSWLKNLEQGQALEFRPVPLRNWIQYTSIAAAISFLVLSAVLWGQRTAAQVPDAQLRALASLEEPERLDFGNLKQTSVPLSGGMEETYLEAVRLFKERKFRDASLQFEELLQAKPDHSASVFLLGYCYYEMGQPEKAFDLCDRAESIHPHSYTRCMSLVQIALKTGHFGRAVREITVLYHEAPQIPEVRELYRQITSLTRGRTLKM